MKKLFIFIFTIIGLVSCTKEESLSRQEDQILIDWNTELKKSEWIYYSWYLRGQGIGYLNEKWKFLNDSNIQSAIVTNTDTTVTIHTFKIFRDSFILTPKYPGISFFVPFANLTLSNDTVFWRYHNMTDSRVFLIKSK
jgi:hypothetical protein